MKTAEEYLAEYKSDDAKKCKAMLKRIIAMAASRDSRIKDINEAFHNDVLALLSDTKPRPSRYEKYLNAWRIAYSGELKLFRGSRMGIRHAEDKHGSDRVYAAFKRYLTETEPKFASLSRFLETIGAYFPEDEPVEEPAGEKQWK